MQFIDIFRLKDQAHWIEKIAQGDWGAATFLAKLLSEGNFHAVLGDGTVYLLTKEDEIVSFVTLTHQDCINDKTLFPWLGFFYTFPQYRGHRYGGKLLDYAVAQAGAQGYGQVWLATDHVGLYEKYGFTYRFDRVDVYGENSRIYTRATDGKTP